jgi:hypothetical protein
MDRQLFEWKLGIDRIWSAAAPDYHEAACLAAEIARASSEAMLRQAASQALPILRSASHAIADQATLDAARRRLGVVREVLHTLTEPRFGRREQAAKLPTLDERHRQTLGLPFDRGLSIAENPPGLQACRQDRTSRRRRQRAGFSGTDCGARRADTSRREKGRMTSKVLLQNAQMPVLIRLPLRLSASRKVGTGTPTMMKLYDHGVVGMPSFQIWQKPVSDQRIR